ncbi:MAG: PHB depolymerase family esterase [Chitinispirillaceae bacterium]|nr:PHB depolymerase family esterase [Chitinispirillaceae bacterium]
MQNSINAFLRCVSIGILVAGSVSAGTYTEITDFSDRSETIKMFLYLPDNVPENPPVLVALHWCSGSAGAIYSANTFNLLADRYGFIVIYPDANSSDGCWDVHSEEVLTHDGGGDSRGIVAMVKYVLKNYHADSTRVFASGISSGAMMTNVLLGAYPDVFKAGAAFAGVPFGCFAGPDRWNGECSQGNLIKTAQEWGDLVRAAFPEYNGPRPRIQLWHGDLDDGLHYNNFGEEIKQWTNVLGISQTPTSTEENMPSSDMTRTRYTNSSGVVMVEGIVEHGMGHSLTVMPEHAIAFLGLDDTGKVDMKRTIAGEKNGNENVRISGINNGFIDVLVFSHAVQFKCDLYRPDGKKVLSVTRKSISPGESRISWPRGENEHRWPPGIYIVSVAVNGIAVREIPFAIYSR